MLLLNKKHIDEIKIIDINEYIYAPVTRNDVWKVELVKKLIEVKYDQLQLDNISKKVQNKHSGHQQTIQYKVNLMKSLVGLELT